METVEEALKDAVNDAADGPATRKKLEQVERALTEAVESTSRAIANATANATANNNSSPDAVDIVTVLAYIRYELTDMVAKCVSAENMKERALLLISFIDSKENSLKDSGSLIDNRIVKQEASDGSFKDISDAYGLGGIGGSSSSNFHSMEWKTESAVEDNEATIIEDSTSEEETKRRRRRKRGPRKSLTPRKALTPKQRKALKIVLPKITKTKAAKAAKKPRAPKDLTGSRQCNVCHKMFANRSACCKHKKLHSETPACSCTWCKKDFKRKEDYKLHLVRSGHINLIDRNKDKGGKLNKHGDMDKYIEKVLGCEFCDRIFDRMSAFKGHMRVHVNEIPGEENPPTPTSHGKGKHPSPNKGPADQIGTNPPFIDGREAPLPGHGGKVMGTGARGNDPNFRGDPHSIMPTDFTSNLLYKNQQSDALDMMSKTPTSTGANDQGLNMAKSSGDNTVGTHDGDRLVCHECPYCSFFSYNEEKLNDHKKCHDSERPFQCKICERRFTVEPCLEQHQSLHSEDKPHCCETCGKTYPSLSQLYAHEYSHIGISNYKCDRCAASFTSKAGLERHMNFHDGKRDHICDVCGKSFFAKSELTGHIRAHHKKKVFMHSCEICQKPFVSRGELNKHMTVHSDERPFTCACCGKGFSRKIYLSKHMIIHTMERPYKCTKCPKAFAFVSNLTTHERIHTGEKPYSCHVCGKRSSDVANHIKHMKIHKKDGAPSAPTTPRRRQQNYQHNQPSQHHQQQQQQQQQQQEQQQQQQQQPLPVSVPPPPIFQQPPPQQEPLNLNPAAFDPNFHMMDGSPYEAYRRHEFPWASFARP